MPRRNPAADSAQARTGTGQDKASSKRKSNAKDSKGSRKRPRKAGPTPKKGKRKKAVTLESINGPPMDWWELPTRGQLQHMGIDLEDEKFYEHAEVKHDYAAILNKSDPQEKAPLPDMGYNPPKHTERPVTAQAAKPRRANRQARPAQATRANGSGGADEPLAVVAEEAQVEEDLLEEDMLEEALFEEALVEEAPVQEAPVQEAHFEDISDVQQPPARTTPEQEFAPDSLMRLHADVRTNIFMYLLVSDKPVMVHHQWTRLCSRFAVPRSGRSNEVLFPQVLQTCKLFYCEGVKVLYGENIFHYRIRDAVSWEVMAQVPVGSSDDDDAEYYDHAASKRGKKRKDEEQAPGQECRVNFRKFRHLFRKVILEAEYNRVDDQTAGIIADAINVFDPTEGRVQDVELSDENEQGRKGQGASKGKQKNRHKPDVGTGNPPSLHTFILRVAPVWALRAEAFNVLSWFSKNSLIIQALGNIDPQHIYIDLIMRHVYVDYNHGRGKTEKKTPPARDARLKLDMRHKRLVKSREPADKEPAHDAVMAKYTSNRAANAVAQVLDLKVHVLRKCLACVPEARDEEAGDEELAWDEHWDDMEALAGDEVEDDALVEQQ